MQLPVFPVGPLSRFHEFARQLSRTDVSMGSFSYGVRRIVTGLIKAFLIAGPLGATADRLFALRVTRLSTDMAWLGAVCGALEVYFYVSGFSDVGIGLGRILGFRHQENFRRPYTADSIREFWRRWNITLVTWLRDYLALPIAGHDAPTFRPVHPYRGRLRRHRPLASRRVAGHPMGDLLGAWLAVEALGLGRSDATAAAGAFATRTCSLWCCSGGCCCVPADRGRCSATPRRCSDFRSSKFGASSAYFTWGPW